MDRENSFEDLEHFLTQLDWAPPHGSTDDTGSDLELSCDPSVQAEQDGGNVQELEMRALTEHLKAIVKDIHIAVGEHDNGGLMLIFNNFLLLLKMSRLNFTYNQCEISCILNVGCVCLFQSSFCHCVCFPLRV